MGFKVGNDIFAKNSWYFRNALVRANYKNVRKGIQQEPEHLEKFFRNLLMGERNELKNRYLHVDYKSQRNVTAKCHSKNVTAKSDGNSTDAKSRSKVQLNERQKQIVELVKRNPNILQTELADHFGVRRETISRDMRKLVEMKVLCRSNSDKKCNWKVV